MSGDRVREPEAATFEPGELVVYVALDGSEAEGRISSPAPDIANGTWRVTFSDIPARHAWIDPKYLRRVDEEARIRGLVGLVR